MRKMIDIGLMTEYSFKHTYGKVSELEVKPGTSHVGICDLNNTYGHVKFEKRCKEIGTNPIFGVRLNVVKDDELRERKNAPFVYSFIAKNQPGLQEMYQLVTTAWANFYYKPMVTISDVIELSENVFVISDNIMCEDRIDYIALTPFTPKLLLDFDIPKVAMNLNRYTSPSDKIRYQLLAGARKHGDGLRFLYNDQTYPQHILSADEHYRLWNDQEALDNTFEIAGQCDVKIGKAPMVSFKTKETIEELCTQGAFKRKINIDSGEYAERYRYEIGVIKEKEFTDYFLIVMDMVKHAKKNMLVGPARGSAAGSLVAYLLDITEVDPIKHKLLFERFIDINRSDLPDIDIDFPDSKRAKVIQRLIQKFSAKNVCHIANINTLGAKSAINEFGMALSIPRFKVEEVKNSIVDRTGGDARAKMRVEDTLMGTDVGKEFLKEYPLMKYALDAEQHATHAGKHAAGIIVCNDDITNYGAINVREECIMMDKRDADDKNLLKIDCLGLRTLSILEDASLLAGIDIQHFYSLPLDDQKSFDILNQGRFSGIFQFEGQAMRMLCSQMIVEKFDDIVAITALARPGPLHSGGANTFVKRRTGEEPVDYISNDPTYIECTESTYGVIIYQEQLMNICKICANMHINEIAQLRKAASKTLGKHFFDKYKASFLKGTTENGIDVDEATEIWENMINFGSWGMNLSHAVSYGYISYWCAYMKAHYPLEFAVATLNHSRSEDSTLWTLRDMAENDDIDYIPVDPDHSKAGWIVHEGKLLGGLTNVHGIGQKMAEKFVRARDYGSPMPAGVVSKLIDPVTPFDILYPTQHFWGHMYDEPKKYGLPYAPAKLDDVKESGTYIVMGQVKTKDLRDLNEYNELVKRGGKVLESNDKFLRLVIQDDTNQLLCKIDRFKFDDLDGMGWYDKLIEDESWIILKGKISKGWRIINIEAIADLKEISDV